MSVTFATMRFAAAGVAASARGVADGRSTAKTAAMIAGIANAESGRGRSRRNRAMYRNLLRGIPVNFTTLLTSVYQKLANGSKFHFGVFSLNFQLLLRALGEGGAYGVRAATPGGTSDLRVSHLGGRIYSWAAGGRSLPRSEIQCDDQSGCLPVSSSSARPNVGRYLPKFNSKSLGTP